jgi:hypothetical protein
MEGVNQRRKRFQLITLKAHTGEASRWRERWPVEEVGRRREAGLAKPDPKREFKGKIYFWISKTFEILARLWEFLQGDLEAIWTQDFS